MSGERGSITLWMVGLVMVVLAVGGIAVDLWRGLAAHRQLATAVDAAAIAAASGIDENSWRLDGELVLDPGRVEERVAQVMLAQEAAIPMAWEVSTAADGSEATVVASTTVELTLLRLLTEGTLDLTAEATAEPVVSP